MILQTNGGIYGQQKYPYSWIRDLSVDIAQNIVNFYLPTYHIFQVTRPGSFIIWSVKPIHRLRGWDVSDTPLRLHFEMLNNILTIQ